MKTAAIYENFPNQSLGEASKNSVFYQAKRE